MPTQMNLPTLVAEAVLAELARNPERYRSVTPGPKGEDLTLVSIVMEADYSMTLTFSDGTTYSSPPVRGERGPKGVEGDRGPRGVGIHHTRWTATTNPEHHFGVAGHMDTYTLYGDEDELVVLGWFSVKNGENGKDPYDYAVEAGYEDTKDEFYKAIAENATHIEQIRNLVSQIEHLFDMVENKGQEFIDQINQIIADFLAMKGAPGGFAELDGNGKVPVEQIPDEVRGIIRVNTHAELPISGVPRQLYLVVQDETAEGASTLYHWAGFEYRPATSSTTVLGLTELRELLTQLDDAKASKNELAEVADELQATKDDLEALAQLVGTLGDFRELAFVAHHMHLPNTGEDTVLYIVRSDETNFGDLSIYAWSIDGYRRVSGKMQEAVNERIGTAESTLLDHEQRLAIVEAFREVIGFAHFMHLPATGDATKLYVIASDETFGGDLTAYRWSETLGIYTRMYGKAFADIKERLEVTESGKVEGDTFETYVKEVAKILNNYVERLTLLEEKDEVIEVNTRYDLPATGEHGVIYVVRHDSLSNNKATIHIWNGADYSPIVSACDTALGEVSSSASEVLATQVWNTSINDIPAGTPVMLAGHAINEQPAVVPLDLNDPKVLSKFVGIVYKTVPAGRSGVAVRGGVVRNFNTLGGDENWKNGDALYFRGNGSGVISNVIPSIANYNKPVGYVLEAADNKGILYLVQDPVGNILGGDGGDGNGTPGKSAYEIAVEVEGFTGTKAEWLQSLVGPEGPRGKSAYESAVEGGYTGTEAEWALAAKGKDGEDGKSNYELAVENGYTGTLSEWLETLKGERGADGKSAYEVAVDKGFTGTEQEWLQSLVGDDDTLRQDLANPDKGAAMVAYGNKSVNDALDQVAVVDYAPGITLTGYNQLVRDENGEFWRVSGQVDLPYVITGAGIPEGDAFVPAGDAALRQEIISGSLLTASMISGVSRNITDVVALRATAGRFDGEPINLLAYGAGYSNGGGGGLLYWDAASTVADDGGITFAVSGVLTGRWVRRVERFVDAAWYGLPLSGGSCITQDAAIEAYCFANKISAWYGPGIYDFGESNWSWSGLRIAGQPLKDYNGVRIYSCPEAIFRTTSVGGADVMQCCGIKNFGVIGFPTVTAILNNVDDTLSGSNALSLVFGAVDCVFELTVKDMPGIYKSTGAIDGGQGFSIQPGVGNTNPYSNVILRGSVDGATQGFGCDYELDNQVDYPLTGIRLDLDIANCYRGVVLGGAAAVVGGAAFTGISGSVRIRNCQQAFINTRTVGTNLDIEVVNTLAKEALVKHAFNPEVIVASIVAAKDGAARVYGRVLTVDTLLNIGGTSMGGGQIGTTSEFTLEHMVTFSGATNQVVVADFGGNAVNKSRISLYHVTAGYADLITKGGNTVSIDGAIISPTVYPGDDSAVAVAGPTFKAVFAVPLTTIRSVFFPSSARVGDTIRAVRLATATGGGVSVGGLINIAAGTWAEATYSGSAWAITGRGSV